MRVVLLVVNQSERGNRPGFETQIFFHALFGCERQFPLMKSLFEVVDCKRAVAVEDYKIVTVALVIAEKQVLAMLRTVGMPILSGDFDGWSLGVSVEAVFDIVGVEIVQYRLHSFHD